MEPQLFHSTNEHGLQSFIEDRYYAFEQKVDGMRMMVRITDQEITFLTRGGRPLKSTAATQHFNALHAELDAYRAALPRDSEVFIDGEIMTDTGKLVAFDMPSYIIAGLAIVGVDSPNYVRYREMHQTVNLLMSDAIKPVRRESTTGGKQLLVKDVEAMGGEGIIIKHRDSVYQPGVRVKHSLKYKFTETADVIVIAKNSGESKHSKRGGQKINYKLGVVPADMELIDVMPEDIVHVGNCSGIGKDDAEVGDVIEVKYLYRGAGGKLVQPTMLRKRPDKRWDECSETQLKKYSKEVL